METYQTQSQNHRTPEADIVQRLFPADPLGALQHDDRKLEHLAHKAVTAELLGDAGHDDLVANGRHEERDDGRGTPPDMRARRTVDVSSEEAVDGNIPLAAELHPVCAVPPVAVKVSIGEARDLGKGAQDVLEDDEEYEQEGQHEGEKQPGDGLCQNEEGLDSACRLAGPMQSSRGFL